MVNANVASGIKNLEYGAGLRYCGDDQAALLSDAAS